MCWVCAANGKAVVTGSLSGAASESLTHFRTAAGSAAGLKLAGTAEAFSFKTLPTADVAFVDADIGNTSNSDTVFLTTTDNVADDRSTTHSIAVNGAHIVSTIDAPADQDFYKVVLQAGKTYEIGQYAAVGGPSGVPLADAYLELYDSSGKLVAFNDGGGQTPSGQIYGLDSMITFKPTVSGTYYINARAFDNNADDGSTKGDVVGDYELFVDVSTYRSYYNDANPLHAIDWGTQVDGTSRNPDGAEGPRKTGNDYQGQASNPYGIEGKNVITVYFAKAGEVYVSEDPLDPGLTTTMVAKGFQPWEMNAMLQALAQYEKVADIVYVQVEDRHEADFTFITYNGTPGRGAPSVLGRMSPPDTANEGQMELNAGDERWTEAGLQPGGFYFGTLIHELGHGHGLAHTHDNGGRSSIMRGVVSAGIETEAGTIPDPTDGVWPNYTHGDYNLNQGVYTMMSYEDGWEDSPYGQASSKDSYGWLGGLMAFDIAAIQDKYGVNEDTAKGNDVYRLKDANATGTFWSSIWDAGGTDSIVYSGQRNAVIDLRPATLKYEEGGGGWLSYAWGIHGGYTVANGVTIENASSGYGNDKLTGNGAANILDAGAGHDTILGGGGHDLLHGRAGTDLLKGDSGTDRIYGGDGNDRIYGGGGTDTLDGGAGYDRFFFEELGPGLDRILNFHPVHDAIYLSRDAFRMFTGSGVDPLAAGAFHKGKAAHDASDRIIYDQATGNIFYDPDGSGGGAPILFARVDVGTQLTSADFVIYG